MKTCDYCTHVEMCGWRKEVKEQGCEFFGDGIGWIPCSERLPEEDVPVLVAVKTKDRLPKWVEKQTYHYVTDIDVWDADGGWFGNKRNVTAWMPLPKPYREDGEA